MLKIKNLSKKYYKDRQIIDVLNNINLEIACGELVAIQGPSGCGKTTLLLIAGGLLHPDEGNIFFNSVDIWSQTFEKRAAIRAENFGFVFQQYHLIPYLTVFESILVPDLAIKNKKDHNIAFELIERFGLSHRKTHIPAELSAGEKQRTALARAMIHRPPLILADEITGNLDEYNATIVIEALKTYTLKGGMVLYVTHDSGKAKFADRVIKFDKGKLTS